MGLIASDSYTEPTVDKNLESHTPDNGAAWVEWFSTASEKLKAIASTGNCRAATTTDSAHTAYKMTPNPGNANVDVKITVKAIPPGSDNPFFLFARGVDADNWYAAGIWDDGTIGIYENTATVIAALNTGSLTLAVDDVIRFELIGTALTIYQNDVSRLTITDATLSAAGICGHGMGNIVNAADDINYVWRFDDFSVVDYATAAASTPILIQGPNMGFSMIKTFTM